MRRISRIQPTKTRGIQDEVQKPHACCLPVLHLESRSVGLPATPRDESQDSLYLYPSFGVDTLRDDLVLHPTCDEGFFEEDKKEVGILLLRFVVSPNNTHHL